MLHATKSDRSIAELVQEDKEADSVHCGECALAYWTRRTRYIMASTWDSTTGTPDLSGRVIVVTGGTSVLSFLHAMFPAPFADSTVSSQLRNWTPHSQGACCTWGQGLLDGEVAAKSGGNN